MTQTISVRKLHSDLPNIARQVKMGVTFVVFKNSEPIFEIRKVEHVVKDAEAKARSRKEFLEGLEALIGDSGETDLSQRVDEIVYGV